MLKLLTVIVLQPLVALLKQALARSGSTDPLRPNSLPIRTAEHLLL